MKVRTKIRRGGRRVKQLRAYTASRRARSSKSMKRLLLMACVSAAVSAVRADAAVTFARDVAPILYAHCVACHQPDGAAPFSLLTYNDARRRASLIAHVTRSRYMPPWMPEETGFIGDRRLAA